jgi:chromosome segregation ATPase
MGKRKQQKSDCVCDHPGYCVCLPQAAVTWVPDTRPRQDNPDPNEAYRLDLELAAKFRELVELAATDPHLPGRLREAVAELKDEARSNVVLLQAELEKVKSEWYEPERYDEDTKALEAQVSEVNAQKIALEATIDRLTDELADLCLENDRLRSMLTLSQVDGC